MFFIIIFTKNHNCFTTEDVRVCLTSEDVRVFKQALYYLVLKNDVDN